VALKAIAGEQVFLGHVTYAPGTTVARHAHPEAEQAMWIVEGSLRMTVGDETRELPPCRETTSPVRSGTSCWASRATRCTSSADGFPATA
jgi:uncharacterized cupin superfamily protein